MRKGYFSESKVEKMSKKAQVPSGGMIGNDHFGELVDIKEPMEEQMTQWKHKMTSKMMMMCLLRMINLGYMIFFISFKMPLKTMLNFTIFL